MTMTEQIEVARKVAQAVDIPVSPTLPQVTAMPFT